MSIEGWTTKQIVQHEEYLLSELYDSGKITYETYKQELENLYEWAEGQQEIQQMWETTT